MTRTIEITAKSQEEALSLAKGELNDNEVIVSSETLSAPAKGIFGFVGKQEYKIRFVFGEKPEEIHEPKVSEAASLDKISDDFDDDYDDADFVSTLASAPTQAPAPAHKRVDSRPERNSVRDNRSRGPRKPNPRNNDREAEQDFDLPERPKAEVSEEIKNHPQYREIFDLISAVADNVGIPELATRDYVRDGAWVIEASGENVSQLIGKRGRTLDSLQYLMNIILNKGNEDRIKLVLDVQGYREKRYRNLMMLASRMCRKAVSSRKQVELEPMSTLDRRTIHMALKDRKDIETFSKGMEPMRRVVIAPLRKKKANYNADWQPVAEQSDSDFSDKIENTGSVPMFLEEDV